MAKETLDAVITARSIHDGDYSSLRGKSFLVCGKMKKKKTMNNKKTKNRVTLAQISNDLAKLNQKVDGVNSRIDNLEKDINTRLDNIEKRLDYNNLKQLPK